MSPEQQHQIPKENIHYTYLQKFVVHNFQMTFLCLYMSIEMFGVITVALLTKYANCDSAITLAYIKYRQSYPHAYPCQVHVIPR